MGAPVELRADREIVLAAVRRNGYALRYASAELKADKEVVLAAITADADAGENYLYKCPFQYAAAALKADREFVLAAAAQNGKVLEWAHPRVQRLPCVRSVALTDEYDMWKSRNQKWKNSCETKRRVRRVPWATSGKAESHSSRLARRLPKGWRTCPCHGHLHSQRERQCVSQAWEE